jgi:hypothetical protein
MVPPWFRDENDGYIVLKPKSRNLSSRDTEVICELEADGRADSRQL